MIASSLDVLRMVRAALTADHGLDPNQRLAYALQVIDRAMPHLYGPQEAVSMPDMPSLADDVFQRQAFGLQVVSPADMPPVLASTIRDALRGKVTVSSDRLLSVTHLGETP